MKSRSRTAPKKDTAPPSTPEDGAKRFGELAVKVFDRKDGTGADWPLVAESLFRAAFAVLDKLEPDARHKLAGRVHALAYDRYLSGTGSSADDLAARNRASLESAATVKAALAAAFGSPAPKGPR